MHILIGYGYFPYTTGIYFERALATEHQVTFVGTASADRSSYAPDVDIVAVAQSLDQAPDLFLYVDSGHLSYLPRNLHKLPCPTAAYLIDVHLGPGLRVPLADCFDYVFIAQRDFLPDYRRHSQQVVEWLPLACELPAPRKPVPRSIDVGFVGNVSREFDDPRAQMIKMLDAQFTMNDYRQLYLPHEMLQLYQQSKTVFNHAIRNDVNMRVFEAMGGGALLVTNRIGNGLLDLFEEDKHLVVYDSPHELIEKVTYFLEHEAERLSIAAAGEAEISAKHTYSHRANQILETVFDLKPGARGPLRSASPAQVGRVYIHLYSMLRLLDATMTQWTDLKKLKAHRVFALSQLTKALLRRVYHG